MTLTFKKKFVAKIWAGLLNNNQNYVTAFYPKSQEPYRILRPDFARFYYDCLLRTNINDAMSCRPKVHTIRKDTKNRWKAGRDIHFVINNRTPNRLQFAPALPVIATQHIAIQDQKVWVDARLLGESEIETLAKNDGFDSVSDFFQWFEGDFEGKIIHWTNILY